MALGLAQIAELLSYDGVELIDIADLSLRKSIGRLLALEIPAIERKRHAAGRADNGAIPLDRPLYAARAGQHISGARLAQIELLAGRERDEGAAFDQDDGERVSGDGVAGNKKVENGAANSQRSDRGLDRVVRRICDPVIKRNAPFVALTTTRPVLRSGL